MPSKQEELRERVVTFYLKNNSKPKVFTVNHFKAEEVPERTVYGIIRRYENRLRTERAPGSGCYFQKMDNNKVRELQRKVDHSDKWTVSSAARKYKVHRNTKD